MTLRNKDYRDRLLDRRVEQLLGAFGAVEIVGSMWCGKTWTAEAHGETKISLAYRNVRELVEADLDLAFQGKHPHIIDEWQEIPSLWDEARIRIDDAGGERGLFILTGSSTPAKGAVFHSGTGRIARVHLRPMGLLETGNSTGEVSLSGLFEGDFSPFQSTGSLRDIARLICRGGWPGLLSLQADSAALVPAQYLDTLLSSTSEQSGINEHQLGRLMHALARNLGQAVTFQTLASDMVEGNLKDKRAIINMRQIEKLLNHLKSRFLIEDISGWDAPLRSRSRVRLKPKRSFVDPSLPAALLGITEERLLEDSQLFGKLFEELCFRDLRILVSAMEAASRNPLKYYADSDNLEVDAIIELRDGRWAAIEVKLGENKINQATESLLRLRAKVAANPLAQNREPSFMAVLVGKADFCRKTPEGIYVIPITSLGL